MSEYNLWILVKTRLPFPCVTWSINAAKKGNQRQRHCYSFPSINPFMLIAMRNPFNLDNFSASEKSTRGPPKSKFCWYGVRRLLNPIKRSILQEEPFWSFLLARVETTCSFVATKKHTEHSFNFMDISKWRRCWGSTVKIVKRSFCPRCLSALTKLTLRHFHSNYSSLGQILQIPFCMSSATPTLTQKSFRQFELPFERLQKHIHIMSCSSDTQFEIKSISDDCQITNAWTCFCAMFYARDNFS